MLWCGRYFYLLSVSTSDCLSPSCNCTTASAAARFAMQMPQRPVFSRASRTVSHTTSVNWHDLTSALSTCTLSVSCTADDSAQPPAPPPPTQHLLNLLAKKGLLWVCPRGSSLLPLFSSITVGVGALRGCGEEDWLAAAVIFKVKTYGVTGWISSHTYKDALTDRMSLVPANAKQLYDWMEDKVQAKASRSSHSALKLLFLSSVKLRDAFREVMDD